VPRGWCLQVMSFCGCEGESMRVCACANAISLATDTAAFQMLPIVRVREDSEGDEWWTGTHTHIHTQTHTQTHTHTHTDGVGDA
jgi:hypothetical protein